MILVKVSLLCKVGKWCLLSSPIYYTIYMFFIFVKTCIGFGQWLRWQLRHTGTLQLSALLNCVPSEFPWNAFTSLLLSINTKFKPVGILHVTKYIYMYTALQYRPKLPVISQEGNSEGLETWIKDLQKNKTKKNPTLQSQFAERTTWLIWPLLTVYWYCKYVIRRLKLSKNKLRLNQLFISAIWPPKFFVVQ